MKIAADKELAEKAAAAERAAAEKRAADKLAEDKLAAKKLAAERMRLAQVPALELLNQAYDPAAVDRTEQAAKNEIDRLEAVPDGPNKDYDEVVMQQAILGFAQLKLNKQFEGHTSLGKCRTWQNTQLKHDATYNRIFALTSAATALIR